MGNSAYLGSRDETAKPRETVEQDLLIHHRVQVSDEELGTDLDRLLLVGASLVDTDGLAIEADLVHDLGGIVGFFLALEFDEAVALVGLGNAIFRKVDVLDAASLEHELPN